MKMKHLLDLINLSEIEFPIEQEGWFKCKILRLIQTLQSIENTSNQTNSSSSSTIINMKISIDVNNLPFAAISMFTVFELFALIIMSVLHENKPKNWFIIPSLTCLTITHLLCVLKYLLIIPVGMVDGIEMFECLFVGLTIVLYMIFNTKLSLKRIIWYITINNIYQIVYALTDSKFFMFLPILLFCCQIGFDSKNLYIKILCLVMFINHIMYWLNNLLFFDYRGMYHLVNIPCIYLIWYSLLLIDEKSTRLIKKE